MTNALPLKLRVHALRCEARDVLWIDLRDADGGTLPPFAAGAHLEVQLREGLLRHYSLCNDPRETHRYCLGVGLARDSRGGSKLIHDSWRVGTVLRASAPRNHFALDDGLQECVFIAGGIGITPILAMIRHCEAIGRPWRLYYCARNRVRAAFYEDLNALPPGRVHYHFDDEQPGRLFDPAAVLAALPLSVPVYTCGPEPLMRAVEAAGATRAPERLHFEWFSAAPVDSAADRPFTVRLARSGRELLVPAGISLLDVLEAAGEPVPWACREGTCGTCRTDVVAGECEHRDQVLSTAEKAGHKAILVCVSRAKAERIELDL